MSFSFLERLESAVRQHEEWRGNECLNLMPSENTSSKETRALLSTDLGNRYSAPDKFYRGTKFLDEVQALAEEVARKLFNARFVDVRLLSGHHADMAILMALTKRGDKVLSVSPENGGYPGISHQGLGSILELKNLYFPYDNDSVNIDLKASKRLVVAEKPKLIIFGASYILFPQPAREISDVADNAVCAYDGAHIMGLIAGREFQDPLREGCSFLIGSTHKSFPGPQGGLILSNNERLFSEVAKKIYPGMVDNIHWNRVAALALSLMEMLEFGRAYASAVVRNSQSLGKFLDKFGVRVRGVSQGYSRSHQVLLDYESRKCEMYSARLEQANIMVDNGGRLGVGELTRRGMMPKDMEQVADLISLVILGKKPLDFVQKRVRSLIKDFKEPKYTLRPAAEIQR